jgi:hypothetical protein
MGLSKQKWLDPKLSVFFRAFNVNVDWLFSLSTEKKEPVSILTENLGHSIRLAASIRDDQAAVQTGIEQSARGASSSLSVCCRNGFGGIHGPLETKTSQRIQNPEHSLPVREPDRLDAGGRLRL